jgi:Na+/proline symporter
VVIGAYCLLVLGIGIVLARKASRSADDYFLSGRSLPWWLAGTSMAATSFSVDTPLYVTTLVRQHGIFRNWEWWSWALGGAMAAFVFAPLWRRARVLTDVELTLLRYSGWPAHVLRSFRALYLGLVLNGIGMASVYLALSKVLEGTLGWEGDGKLLLFGGIAVVYSLLSGFWGVVVTDALQFTIAFVASVVIAVFAVGAAGGLGSLAARVAAASPRGAETLSLFPSASASDGAPVLAFLVFLTVSWWANQNADGGGKIVQRMSACKDERNAWLATFWFNLAHYALRTWPWILAALASIVLYPELADPETAYPLLIADLLPSGWKGFAIVSLVAAFMSTVDTQMNWGASYLVNDVYRPLARRLGVSSRHEIKVSWTAGALVTAFALLLTAGIDSVTRNFHFLIAFGSGAGSVYVLRWFWWRVGPWSEMAAMVTSGVVSTLIRTGCILPPDSVGEGLHFPLTMLLVVGASTVVWVGLTLLLPRPDPRTLVAFYERVQPGGAWGPVRELAAQGGEARELETTWSLGRAALLSLLAAALVLSLTLLPGAVLLGEGWIGSLALLLLALASGGLLVRGLRPGGG